MCTSWTLSKGCRLNTLVSQAPLQTRERAGGGLLIAVGGWWTKPSAWADIAMCKMLYRLCVTCVLNPGTPGRCSPSARTRASACRWLVRRILRCQTIFRMQFMLYVVADQNPRVPPAACISQQAPSHSSPPYRLDRFWHLRELGCACEYALASSKHAQLTLSSSPASNGHSRPCD
jgi:hypothetical protein